MITVEYLNPAGFAAPEAPRTIPEGSFDYTTLPHAKLDEFVGISPTVNVNMGDVSYDTDGRIGMRSADPGQPAIFRVGQRVNITFDTGVHELTPYYIGHDGALRDFDPKAEIAPIEVATFRQGLAEREARVREEISLSKTDILSIQGDEIGAMVLSSVEVEPPQRFAKLRSIGRMALASFIPTEGGGRHRAKPAHRNTGAGSQGWLVGRHRRHA